MVGFSSGDIRDFTKKWHHLIIDEVKRRVVTIPPFLVCRALGGPAGGRWERIRYSAEIKLTEQLPICVCTDIGFVCHDSRRRHVCIPTLWQQFPSAMFRSEVMLSLPKSLEGDSITAGLSAFHGFYI